MDFYLKDRFQIEIDFYLKDRFQIEIDFYLTDRKIDFRIALNQLLLLPPIILFLNGNVYWGYHVPVSTFYVGCMV